jgi:hypothetical protein
VRGLLGSSRSEGQSDRVRLSCCSQAGPAWTRQGPPRDLHLTRTETSPSSFRRLIEKEET